MVNLLKNVSHAVSDKHFFGVPNTSMARVQSSQNFPVLLPLD